MGSAALEPLAKSAIEAALNNNWKEAVGLNLSLLKLYPQDVETLNRLARAFLESGKINKARSTYKRVLSIDPYNSIANRNLKKLTELKLKDLRSQPNLQTQNGAPVADIFLEEPGKTKILKVIGNHSTSRRIATLRTADPVTLKGKYNRVLVLNLRGQIIGELEEEWGKKISKVIRFGSKFEALVISVSAEVMGPVSILVREVEHSPKLVNQVIFPIEKTEDFKPDVSEETISPVTEDPSAENEEEMVVSQKSPHVRSHASLESLAEKEQEAYDSLEEES